MKLHKYFLCTKKTKIILSIDGQKASDFIKNILICFIKMKEGCTGLEHHEGE